MRENTVAEPLRILANEHTRTTLHEYDVPDRRGTNCRECDALATIAARRASDAQVAAFRGLALKWAAHSGACCTFEDDNSVVVTRESCRCGPVERAAQEALGMFGRPDEYRAALAATPAPQPATPPLDVERQIRALPTLDLTVDPDGTGGRMIALDAVLGVLELASLRYWHEGRAADESGQHVASCHGCAELRARLAGRNRDPPPPRRAPPRRMRGAAARPDCHPRRLLRRFSGGRGAEREPFWPDRGADRSSPIPRFDHGPDAAGGEPSCSGDCDALTGAKAKGGALWSRTTR